MADATEGWRFRLCGRVVVSPPGAQSPGVLPGRQGRLLLGFLVVNRGRTSPRDELIDLLWPDGVPPSVDSALSALLSKLRRALGPGSIDGRGELRLSTPEPVWVDSEQAASAAAAAADALTERRWADAAAQARLALGLTTEPFLSECGGPWVDRCRLELEAVRLRALEALAEAGAQIGGRELDAAEQAARAAIVMAPFRESAHRLLMEAHEAAGNQAEALRAYERLRTLLREELGMGPGPATMAVHERLLRGGDEFVAAALPSPGAGAFPVPLDAATRRHAFVGRTAYLQALWQAWRESLSDDRRLVLLAGEPGIGKTRLAAEFAAVAHAEGAVVLYGRFDAGGPAAYQPVMEMLRGWSGGGSLGSLGLRLGARAADLGALLPEFGTPAPELLAPSAQRGEGDLRRLRLFDALAALLADLSGGAPLVLVFDDLHWADQPTVALLRHLLRAPQPRRTMFVGTYRDLELEDGDPLGDLVASARREGMLSRIDLGGLARVEISALVNALGTADAPEPFVEALAETTEGNPFFIEEVLRGLAGSDHGVPTAEALERAGVPEGVREVTSRRIARLSPAGREVVQVASAVGREVSFDLLEAIGPVTGDALVAALGEAVGARVLREVDGHVGRFAFSHGLIRATLYDGLTALRRARLHGEAGAAILALHAEDIDPWLPQLARHFAGAAPVEGPERAIDYALAAGRRADRLLAWEEAAGHYGAALHARRDSGVEGDRVGCELLLALGASQERTGLEASAATFATAAGVARALGDAGLLGRAALGVAGPWSILGREDPEVVELLEQALALLGDDGSPLRARLLSRLSLELYYSSAPERRLELSGEAVELARRLGDAATLATALDARHRALWRPETLDERIAVAGELRRLAEEAGDLELELEGAGWTVVDLLELGDVAGADLQIDAASQLAAVVRRPLYLWWTSLFRCTGAQLAGDFEEAERLAGETLAIGQRGQAENAVHYYAMAMFNIRREQGRLGEVEDAVAQFVETYPAIPAWRGVQALLHVELGRPEQARAILEAIADPGFDVLPRDANWMIAVTLLAEVCGALGDEPRADEIYTLLEPYAGRNVVVGRAASCNGSASRLLGILAGTLRRWKLAERHFAEALAMHEKMGTKPWVARTQLAWGEMLLARAAEGDLPRGRERLAEAIVAADALGMVAVAERARGLVAGGEGVRPGA